MNDQSKPPSGPPAKPGQKGQQVQVQIDDAIVAGVYSNFMLVNHNENEFVLDLAYLLPGTPRAKVVSRVILSPKHMKRVADTLKKNLEKYEERFGEITPLEADSGALVH